MIITYSFFFHFYRPFPEGDSVHLKNAQGSVWSGRGTRRPESSRRYRFAQCPWIRSACCTPPSRESQSSNGSPERRTTAAAALDPSGTCYTNVTYQFEDSTLLTSKQFQKKQNVPKSDTYLKKFIPNLMWSGLCDLHFSTVQRTPMSSLKIKLILFIYIDTLTNELSMYLLYLRNTKHGKPSAVNPVHY